ncbi:hypothetical protein ACOSQ2_028268 [Xanthoceras sorbifolium]
MRRLKEKRKGKNKAKSSDSVKLMVTLPPLPPPHSRGKESLDMGSFGRKRRRDDSAASNEALVDLVVEVEKLRASGVEAKRTVEEASRRATEATFELERLKSEVDKLRPLQWKVDQLGAQLKVKESEYDAMYDRVEDNMLNAVVKTRADLMRQYKEGRAAE